MRSPHQMAYIQTLLNIASRQGFFNHERGAVAKRERRIRASPSNKPAGDPNTESPIIEQRAGDLMALPEQSGIQRECGKRRIWGVVPPELIAAMR